MISISARCQKRAAAAFPIVLSVLTFGLSIYVFSSTLHATLEGNLRNHMLAYADKFEKVISNSDDPFTVEGYRKLSDQDKARVQMVSGLLAGVVDLMNESNDPRADRWAASLIAIPGPLAAGYALEGWVRNAKTINEIETARQRIKATLKQ
jgi:hypothetical protein